MVDARQQTGRVRDVIHLFWDQSNIFIGARDAVAPHETLRAGDLRVEFQRIVELAAAGRSIERAIAVGSIPPSVAAVWDRLREAGVEVELQERGAESGKEQGVDQALRLKMLESLVDYEEPAVAVLLTGDGGFAGDAQRLLRGGWGVEVLSWKANLSGELRRLTVGYGGRGKVDLLDDFYEQITYLEPGALFPERPCAQIDTSGRHLA